MEIVDSTVITGAGVTCPQGRMSIQSMGDVVVPLMMSTKKIMKDEEVLCYYKDEQTALKKTGVS